MTRDEVVAAIYEAVIRPACFGAFLDTWREHIAEALADPARHHLQPGGEDEVTLDPELAAHFARAQELLDRLGRDAPEIGLCERVEQSPGFVLVLTPEGAIVAAGAAARTELGDEPRLTALEDMLAVQSRKVLRELMQALREDADARELRVLATGTVPRHLIVRVAYENGVLLIVEALDFRWSARAAQMLVDSFGLTPAEVELVRKLMAGETLREIAARTGRSAHTVRNQAKSVLAKTGAPGQVDLIRLVALLVKAESRSAPGAPAAVGLRSEIMRMSSGLEMQVVHAGTESGFPVIFLHGMQDGMSPVEALNERLIRRGYRVIAPVRPGYGRSAPVSPDRKALSVFVGHVDEMIRRLGLRRPLILGYMAGAISGHVLTGRLNGRIAGMLGIAGAVPIRRAGDLASMAPSQRAAAYTARYVPALLPFVLRVGISQIDSREFKGFLDGVFRPGTRDHEVVRRLGLVGAIRSGYRFSVQQGHFGFASDAYFAVRDWSSQISRPAAPVVLLHGELDPVITPDMARAFAARRDNIDLRMVADAGQLLLYQLPELVLDALDEMSGRRSSRHKAG